MQLGALIFVHYLRDLHIGQLLAWNLRDSARKKKKESQETSESYFYTKSDKIKKKIASIDCGIIRVEAKFKQQSSKNEQ